MRSPRPGWPGLVAETRRTTRPAAGEFLAVLKLRHDTSGPLEIVLVHPVEQTQILDRHLGDRPFVEELLQFRRKPGTVELLGVTVEVAFLDLRAAFLALLVDGDQEFVRRVEPQGRVVVALADHQEARSRVCHRVSAARPG